MAATDPVLESLQRLQSMMESFGESLSKLCQDNRSESVLYLWKNLMEYYHDLCKALQSRYETLELKEKKPEYEALKIKEKKPEEPGTRGKNKENKTSMVTVSSPASSSFAEVLSSVNVRPEIKTLCDKSDSCSLINYIVDNRKGVETLRNELRVALSEAPDAANLVLKALEGYDLSNSGSVLREKMEPLCSAKRRACILLLESLFPVFGNDESGIVPSEVKDSAREVAKVWRKEMELDNKPVSASSLDVQAFLQLLVTFRTAADYDKDELCRLVRTILNLKQTPELCRFLGLSSEVPALIRSPIMALRYAHVCGVMDKIDAVGLLRSYLRRPEEAAKVLLTNGHGSADSKTDAKILPPVRTLKNAIMAIKEYGLQSHFCEDDLQNKLRILVQEREVLEKKRKQDTKSKAQVKEDRAKAIEKRAQEEEDIKKASAEKKAQAEEDRNKAAEKKAQEKEDREKAAKKKVQEEEDRKKAVEKKAQEKEDKEKAAEKKAHVTEDRKKDAEKRLQHKRHQSFEPGYGLPERKNYASKRAKHASPEINNHL